MKLSILAFGIVLVTIGSTTAQFPSQPYPGGGFNTPINPNNFMPNIFNPATQPLSPYLNLLRGNPATDYYFGVRPGTIGLGSRGITATPFVAGGGNRTLFFPQLANAPDPLGDLGTGGGGVLPPAGHAVVFGNTMGFFPSPMGQAGGARAGLAGLGTTNPARK